MLTIYQGFFLGGGREETFEGCLKILACGEPTLPQFVPNHFIMHSHDNATSFGTGVLMLTHFHLTPLCTNFNI
jgi:hypothetical protein